MTKPHTVWRSTGLHWESAAPTLTAARCDPSHGRTDSEEHRRVAALGQHIAWRLTGPRTCIGVWSRGTRYGCPSATAIPEGSSDAQCRNCAGADPGRALARDAISDNRTFTLYLAWFGPGLVKVGMTAADRGRDRLLEQAAITYTPLATGSHTTIRRAEHAVTATGLATQRITARTKATAWWTLPSRGERTSQIGTARTQVASRTTWPEQLTLTEPLIVDQAADLGLTQPPPAPT